MSGSTAGWKTVRLGDVVKLKNGYAFKSKDYVAEGTPVIRISDINDDKVTADKAVRVSSENVNSNFFIEPGDLLIAMSGATTGKTGVYTGVEPVLQNQRVGNFKILDDELVDKKYRNYFISSLRKDIEAAAYGGAQPNISGKVLDEFEFPLAPIDVQKSIVAEIEKQFSRLDEAVASLKRVKANLKRYKAAVLKAAVEGKLTEEWRKQNPDVEPASKLLERILAERRTKWEETELAKMKAKGKEPKNDKWKEKYKEPAQPVSDELSALPGSWTWGTWDQISNWVTYGFTRPMEHVAEGVPIVTAKNVADGRIKMGSTHKTPIETYKALSEKDRPSVGDILITKDGTIGRAAIVTDDAEFCINQSVAVIWLRSCPIDRDYLLAVIQSDLTQRPIAARARGVAIKHLSITDFAKLAVPVPSLDEQRDIVTLLGSSLSIVEDMEHEIDANLLRGQRLRQSVLASAFSGFGFMGVEGE